MKGLGRDVVAALVVVLVLLLLLVVILVGAYVARVGWEAGG